MTGVMSAAEKTPNTKSKEHFILFITVRMSRTQQTGAEGHKENRILNCCPTGRMLHQRQGPKEKQHLILGWAGMELQSGKASPTAACLALELGHWHMNLPVGLYHSLQVSKSWCSLSVLSVWAGPGPLKVLLLNVQWFKLS